MSVAEKGHAGCHVAGEEREGALLGELELHRALISKLRLQLASRHGCALPLSLSLSLAPDNAGSEITVAARRGRREKG
eukprot:3934818-Rhodomonas_salina.1